MTIKIDICKNAKEAYDDLEKIITWKQIDDETRERLTRVINFIEKIGTRDRKIDTTKTISWSTFRENCAHRIEVRTKSRIDYEYGWSVSRYDCNSSGLPCGITSCPIWTKLNAVPLPQ